MLSRSEYNLRKSALKRAYNEALQNADVTGIMSNPFVSEALQRQEARKAIRGRGAYARDLGQAAGGYVGSMFGNRHVGQAIGRSLAGYGSRLITGRGAYQFRGSNHRTNRLFVDNQPDRIIEIEEDVDGIVLTRTEFLKQVTDGGTGLVDILTGDINPLNGDLFPWLSQIAQYYREYDLVQCFFEFESTVTGGDTTAKGDVIMASLTPFEDLFSDATSLQNYYSSVSGGADQHILCGIECGKRTGTSLLPVKLTPTGGNPSDYNVGQVQISTNGAASGHAIGNLYVHYMIRLIKPVSKLTSNVSLRQTEMNFSVDVMDGSPLAVASQTKSNIFGATIAATSLYYPNSTGVVGSQSSVIMNTFTGTNNLYYKYTNTSTPVAMAASCVVLWFSENFANTTCKVIIRVPILAQVSGPFTDTGLRIAPHGNVSLVAPANGASTEYSPAVELSKIGTATLSEGLICTFEFTLTFGDVSTVYQVEGGGIEIPGGVALDMYGEGISITYGTTMEVIWMDVATNQFIEPHT